MTAKVFFSLQQTPTIKDIQKIALNRYQVELANDLSVHCEQAQAMLERHQQEGALIYGVNSGFGPLAGYQLPDADAKTLQRNLIYHLATGVGDPIDVPTTRAIMATRLASLSRGFSAVPIRVLEILRDCLNAGVIPVVPSLGTVGASGDLTPLAHIALALIGEGHCWDQGQPAPAAKVLQQHKIKPLALKGREALALVNGVSAMTGLAVLNQYRADQLFHLNLSLGVGISEALAGQAQAYNPLLGQARPHPGQQHVHKLLNHWMADSQCLQYSEFKLAGSSPEWQVPHQDPYSLRCLPQIYGAIADQIEYHRKTTRQELTAASDNPLFFPHEDQIIHGGNFYGQHIAFVSDSLSQAVLKMCLHIERALNLICHPHLQKKYPAFLNAAANGLNSGLMGAQVTATALTAHLRGLAIPMATQSIATNGDNQDVVSMGTLAALKNQQMFPHAFTISAITAIALAQAMDLSDPTLYSSNTKAIYEQVRKTLPFIEKDQPLSEPIQIVAAKLMNEASDF
jgi:tyrosine ammonia-lyase